MERGAEPGSRQALPTLLQESAEPWLSQPQHSSWPWARGAEGGWMGMKANTHLEVPPVNWAIIHTTLAGSSLLLLSQNQQQQTGRTPSLLGVGRLMWQGAAAEGELSNEGTDPLLLGCSAWL